MPALSIVTECYCVQQSWQTTMSTMLISSRVLPTNLPEEDTYTVSIFSDYDLMVL